MCKRKIRKIVKDLQSNKEKTIILALMYIPRLRIDEYHQEEDLNELKTLLTEFQSSSNPDISYLSAKARNFLSMKHHNDQLKVNSRENSDSINPVMENDTGGKSSQRITNVSADTVDSKNFTNFLSHSDERLRAKAVEICTRTLPSYELPKYLNPLLTDINNRVRANVIVALKNTKPEILSEYIRNMLHSPQIGMRESAIWAISKLESNQAYLKLLINTLHDPYRDIRVRTIEVLKNYQCNEVATQMKRLSTDSDSLISQKAQENLSFFNQNTTDFTVDTSSTKPELIESSEKDFVKVNDDSGDSITIKSNFLDLSEPCLNSEIPNKYLINKDFVKTNRITRKIVLHQKIESLDVEEFFDEINPTDEVKINSNLMIDHKNLSPSPSEILSWMPKEYQPDKYKNTLSSRLENQNHADTIYEADLLRKKINGLLIEVGHLEFNRRNKSKLPNTNLNVMIDKIIFIIQKIERVHNNPKLQNDKKKRMIRKLKQHSKEAFILLGRTTIRNHNRIKYKCEDLIRYQRKLQKLIDRLTKINS
ncbi:MAG: HEAT repeat domain-containing protein [bacterium]|nr:HEAT repeat domain-containing protein [bacterium]